CQHEVAHELAPRDLVLAGRGDREVLAPDGIVGGVAGLSRASGMRAIGHGASSSSRPNGSSCHGRPSAPAITSIAPGATATVRTFVDTYWLPNHHSLTSEPVRVSANSSAVPNHSASLGQTDAHIGARPTDVRS